MTEAISKAVALLPKAKLCLDKHGNAQIGFTKQELRDLISALEVLQGLKANAMRYEFLRDPNNWLDDGEQWAILGESSCAQFDQIIDDQMSREATRAMLAERPKP